MLQVLSYSLVPFPVLNTGHLPRPSQPPSVSFPVPCVQRGQSATQVKNTAGQCRPLAVWLIPLLLLSCLLACPACGSCRAPGSAPLRSPATPTSTPPAKRAPFHFPKSLNKQSRKQPRSTTGLPQVRSTESGPKPTQQLPGRLPSQVCVFLVTFLASLCLVNSP